MHTKRRANRHDTRRSHSAGITEGGRAALTTGRAAIRASAVTRLALCLIVVTLTLAACGGRLPDKGRIVAAQGEPLVLGVAASLSGPLKEEGKGIVNAARLAVERHGAVRGHPVEIAVVDDQCDADATESVVGRLVATPRFVGLVGPSCSAGCVAAERVLDEQALVMVTPRCTDISVTRQGFEGVFRTSRTDAVEVVVGADFASNHLGATRVFIVHDGTAYGRGVRDIFRLVFGKDNLAGNEEAVTGSEDYGPVVRAIKKSSARMVYYAGFAEDAARFVRQLREAGVQLPVMAPDAVKNVGSFVAAAGAAGEGVYITEAEADPGPGYGEFAAGYRARFGSDPTPWAAEAYDAAVIVLRAVERTGRLTDGRLSIDRRALREAVPRTDLSGASGRIRYRSNGDRKEGAVVRVYRVTGGRFVEQAAIRPD
jgi:branched-chain amino acid transport system substrate-binding protein